METRNVLFEKSYLNIVFDNRNKAYGAYQLRMEYEKNIAIALFATVLLLVVVPLGLKGYSFFFPKDVLFKSTGPIILSEDINIIPTVEEKKTLKPPKGHLPQDNTKASMLVTQNTTHEVEDTTIQDNLLAINTTDQPSNGPIGNPDGEEGGKADTHQEFTPDPTPYTPPTVVFADEMPEYPGGEAALLNFIRSHVRFPDREMAEGISGNAIVSFVVNENGNVTDVSAVKYTSRGFKQSSEEVMALVPKFKPGKQAGRAVRVKMTLPIRFEAR